MKCRCNGPLGKKDELLLLDGIEDWLGRCRPAILGKEGAAAAKESGVTVLSRILAAAAAAEENCLHHTDTVSSNGWCAGIGEGRSDEENLAAYFRFSEGMIDGYKFCYSLFFLPLTAFTLLPPNLIF